MNHWYIWLVALMVLIYLSSCSEEPIIEDSIDSELLAQLETSSGGIGASFYVLPESDDFGNIPQDPQNPITNEKVELGKLLYHETGLALNPKKPICIETYSCASCHFAAAGFQAGRQQGLSDGGFGFGINGEGRDKLPSYTADMVDVQPIRTPSAMNIAYQTVVLWNGQFGATHLNTGTESQWTAGTPKETNHLGYEGTETQAIAGLEVHRMLVDTNFVFRTSYKQKFDQVFADKSEEDRYTRENAGLAIAAYERTLLSNQSPFQKWLKGDNDAMTASQKEGAMLFFGKAGCTNCHTGPALNSMEFHGLGMPDLDGFGVYGDVASAGENKGRGGFTGKPEDNFKFKVPQLYNLKDSPFYGHGGSFNTIREVIE